MNEQDPPAVIAPTESRFPALSLVRECVENWRTVAWYIWRFKHRRLTGSTDIRFRDGTHLRGIRDSGIALSLVTYYYLGKSIGPYLPGDLRLINTIGTQALSKLSQVFSGTDIRMGRPGAGFGPKNATVYFALRKLRPKLVIETGVAQGVSSFTILSALDQNGAGELASVDWPNREPAGMLNSDGMLDPVYLPLQFEPGWLVPSGLRPKWRLMIGKSSEVLPQISARPQVFIHDSEHSYANVMFELNWAYENLSPGGLILVDDAEWSMAFQDFRRSHPNLQSPLPMWLMGSLRKPG